MDLVAGARGRSLCLSELCGLSEPFDHALQTLELRLEQGAGFDYPPVGSLRAATETVQELVDAIRRVDIGALATVTDPLALLVGVGAAADAAMPWQPPFVRDALAALPPVIEALRPVGAAVAAAPAAAWWTTGVDLAHQYEAAGEPHSHLDELRPAGDALRVVHDGTISAERRHPIRPDDPAAEVGGEWWSPPSTWSPPDSIRLPSSSRRLPEIGAVELAAQEDSFGPERAALRQLRPDKSAVRVYEVQQPSDWAALVASHPIDVSRSRRGVWWQSTGIDGHWFLPDWLAVAADFDAVHLSVHGYLTTAGEPIPVPGGNTVLAGWNPDVTFWLCDMTAGPIEWWRRTSERDMTGWACEQPGAVPPVGLPLR